MLKNLDVKNFRNGDPIPEARSEKEWRKAGKKGKPAWCNYNNDPENGKKFGKLYNWYAVVDPRGLAPVGWHIPSADEWDELVEYLGGPYLHGAGHSLKQGEKDPWAKDPRKNLIGPNRHGNNESGFTALPGGGRSEEGYFQSIGLMGHWWSVTEDHSIYAFGITLIYNSTNIGQASRYKAEGHSVRCLKD